ncbi:hypothetical protein B0J14DRAFT_554994 [Halenospora varia]|nr:hypothetical protein B0J14DRAFT_554994 [Halenospora varia]
MVEEKRDVNTIPLHRKLFPQKNHVDIKKDSSYNNVAAQDSACRVLRRQRGLGSNKRSVFVSRDPPMIRRPRPRRRHIIQFHRPRIALFTPPAQTEEETLVLPIASKVTHTPAMLYQLRYSRKRGKAILGIGELPPTIVPYEGFPQKVRDKYMDWLVEENVEFTFHGAKSYPKIRGTMAKATFAMMVGCTALKIISSLENLKYARSKDFLLEAPSAVSEWTCGQPFQAVLRVVGEPTVVGCWASKYSDRGFT